ncbi:MAG: inverse autotransporter beta domain-containing protein [Chlamydiia bacterium]|nr:inverse autotransporter beta domain-containing protein [Chlamydiia bacterium]
MRAKYLFLPFFCLLGVLFGVEPEPLYYDAIIYDNYPGPEGLVEGPMGGQAYFDSSDNPSCELCCEPCPDFVMPLCCPPPKPCKPVCCTRPTSHLDFGFATGEYIDTEKNYPFARIIWFPECKLAGKYLFYQASLLRFSNYKWAGSAGIGIRWQPKRTCHIVGANLFYDAREGVQDTYHQVGGGIEWLSNTWEARANGYLPVGAKSHLKVANTFDDYAAGFFVQVNNIEQVERGVDVEVGRNAYYNDMLRFYAAIGTAWYERTYSERDEWAFLARAFIEWKRYIRLEVRTFKERDNDWHVQGVATVSFPFEVICLPYSCGLSAPLSEPVYRNMAIKKQRGCCWITNY